MLRHFSKGTPGWVILHLAAIGLILWLGAATRFGP
jgi:hypothetical protein